MWNQHIHIETEGAHMCLNNNLACCYRLFDVHIEEWTRAKRMCTKKTTEEETFLQI